MLPNQGLDLTNPDAAQSVAGAPLCLLSGLAAQAHVGRIRRLSRTTPVSRKVPSQSGDLVTFTAVGL